MKYYLGAIIGLIFGFIFGKLSLNVAFLMGLFGIVIAIYCEVYTEADGNRRSRVNEG